MKYYLGVDLGGTNIAAGVIDENYHLIARESVPTNAGRSPDLVILDLAETAHKVIRKAGLKMENFTSWGIGMPSYVHPETQLLVHANNLGWKNIPIYSYLNKQIDLPVYVENDANCAVLGENLAGAAQNRDNVVMLTLGTGVGSGIMINKKIYSGADGMGAELGHTKLVYHGVECTCGQKGCMEAYCSAMALIHQAVEAMKKHKSSLLWDLCGGVLGQLNGSMIFKAITKGDHVAQVVVEQYIDYLAAGISSFITIFRPEMIILGGGIAEAGDALLVPLQERLEANTFAANEIGIPPVVKAILGNDAGIIGAALLEKNFEKKGEKKNEISN